MTIKETIQVPVLILLAERQHPCFFVPVSGMPTQAYRLRERDTINDVVLNLVRNHVSENLIEDFTVFTRQSNPNEPGCYPPEFLDTKYKPSLLHVSIDIADLMTNHKVPVGTGSIPYPTYLRLRKLCDKYQVDAGYMISMAINQFDESKMAAQ